MTRPNDYYPNDHWVISDLDGGKRLRSECKFGVDTERGLLMGEDEWSPAQPQTNITSHTENLSIKDARPRPPVMYAPGQGPGEKRAVPWVNPPPPPATEYFSEFIDSGTSIKVSFPNDNPTLGVDDYSIIMDLSVSEFKSNQFLIRTELVPTNMMYIGAIDTGGSSVGLIGFQGGGSSAIFHEGLLEGARGSVGLYVNFSSAFVIVYALENGQWVAGSKVEDIRPFVTTGTDTTLMLNMAGSLYRTRYTLGNYWEDNSLINNPIVDFNPADTVAGAPSWVSSTGETYTINGPGEMV